MPNPKTVSHTPAPTTGCFGQGTVDLIDARTGYSHVVHGTAWDALPTAVDRSRLIAAAPALLEAAKKLLLHVSLGDQHPIDYSRLRAAIRQATGEGTP